MAADEGKATNTATTTRKARRSTKAAPSDTSGKSPTTSFRYADGRLNTPPATMAAEGSTPPKARTIYAYNPHLPPTLLTSIDPATTDRNLAATEAAIALLGNAASRPLTKDEIAQVQQTLRGLAAEQKPQLRWAGKDEAGPTVTVDPVALHLHERVSAQAILATAARKDVERSLFADPELPYHEAVQFYAHKVGWANRLILGDSLPVMSSLAEREDLAGRVQMIYMDPPYGIKFASNFQPQIGKRDVKDHPDDLTREMEQVKAFRDTWSLGIHSYLTYLRDRLVAARKLLTDTGSIFVQIGDENVHHIRSLMAEVFGAENHIATITVLTTTSASDRYIDSVADHLVWFARDASQTKFKTLYLSKEESGSGASLYSWARLPTGEDRRFSIDEVDGTDELPEGAEVFRVDQLTSQTQATTTRYGVDFCGKIYPCGKRQWATPKTGMDRLIGAARVRISGDSLAYVRFLEDYPVVPIRNIWTDTGTGSFTDPKRYVVQTNTKIIQRCMLMTTDPGDLVLDPTCGSGTTAYVAEQWGRRWITCDTSRVAVAIARQRLMTAKFDRFRIRGEDDATVLKSNGKGVDPHPNFVYRTVPHVTLKSIAQNVALDPVFAKHQPSLDAALAACNAALAKVDADTRARLASKLVAKQRDEGKRAITDADRRRWELPVDGKTFEHWTVPFDADPLYPKALADAVVTYRVAWRLKMDEVNKVIAAGAEPEVLVDQPEKVKGVVRVSGPFTVEAVQPPETMLGDELPVSGFDGAPEGDGVTFTAVEPTGIGGGASGPQEAATYLENMVRLLRGDGVRFLNNKQARFARLDAIFDTKEGLGFHAEGRWIVDGQPDDGGPATVGVVFGPQYGPVTAKMVEELIKPAGRRYDELVIAGFSFDAAAQEIIANAKHPKLRIHQANISPDVNPAMNGLLKQQPNSHLFTVFGQPRVTVAGPDADGRFVVTMEGVDVYDPVNDVVSDTGADKVAAWFLDGDYDGQAFCTTQAFFPDRGAWEKLAKALGTSADAEAFAAFAGTTSLPFPAGKHGRCAVKVIDPRGNEVMSVHTLATAPAKGR